MLRGIFVSKRDELTREWRKLHNKELNDLYFSSNNVKGDQIERNEMGEACRTYGEEERRIQGFGGKT